PALLTELLHGRAGPKRPLEMASNAAQWRSEIVGDCIRHVADAFHQTLDPIEHAVDIAIQPGELVVRIRHGDATAHVARLDLQRGMSDRSHAMLELSTNQRGSSDREEEGHHSSHQKGTHDELLHLAHILKISAYHEHVTIR